MKGYVSYGIVWIHNNTSAGEDVRVWYTAKDCVSMYAKGFCEAQ